jgi:hypothetical protein
MRKLTPFVLCLGLVFSCSVSTLTAKKGEQNSQRAQGARLTGPGQAHGNGQGSLDRDLGTERAKEVGQGKKKGLHKDQYSIGEGKEKREESSTSDKTTKREKTKKHGEKEKDKDKSKDKT